MSRRKWMFGLMGGIALALGLSATPARAQANQARTCTTMDLAGMLITNVDCPSTGEDVTLTSGSVTLCAHAVVDANGGVHLDGHAEGHGVGVGISGAQYVFNENALVSANMPSGGAMEATVHATAHLIGQGSAPNEDVDVLMHVTFDANGTPTATVDKLSVRCQG